MNPACLLKVDSAVIDRHLLPVMGMSEVVMLDMKGHMVVLGTALGTLMVPGYWSLQMG